MSSAKWRPFCSGFTVLNHLLTLAVIPDWASKLGTAPWAPPNINLNWTNQSAVFADLYVFRSAYLAPLPLTMSQSNLRFHDGFDCYCVKKKRLVQSQQIFAHTKTAVLFWYVQNFVVIRCDVTELINQGVVLIHFWNLLKFCSGTGTWYFIWWNESWTNMAAHGRQHLEIHFLERKHSYFH